MRVTINKLDGIVQVDGEAYRVDLSALPDYVAMVQWFDTDGWIEFAQDHRKAFLPNCKIADFTPYQHVFLAWKAAKIKAAEEAEQRRKEREKQIAEANARNAAVAAALINPDAKR